MHRFVTAIQEFAAFARVLISEDHPKTIIDGLTIDDTRADRRLDHDQVVAVFTEVMEYLGAFDGRFKTLVVTNIDHVHVYDGLRESVTYWGFGYGTPLPAKLRRNTFYLACRLVWTAGFYQALRPIAWYRRPAYRDTARAAGRNAWVAFVRQFPEIEHLYPPPRFDER